MLKVACQEIYEEQISNLLCLLGSSQLPVIAYFVLAKDFSRSILLNRATFVSRRPNTAAPFSIRFPLHTLPFVGTHKYHF